MSSSYLNLIGLAYRARMCSTGEEVIVRDIQQNKAKLVLLASDIGVRTKKKITDKCKTYEIPYVIVDNQEILSKAIGKSNRVAIAILDKGFANKFQLLLKV